MLRNSQLEASIVIIDASDWLSQRVAASDMVDMRTHPYEDLSLTATNIAILLVLSRYRQNKAFRLLELYLTNT